MPDLESLETERCVVPRGHEFVINEGLDVEIVSGGASGGDDEDAEADKTKANKESQAVTSKVFEDAEAHASKADKEPDADKSKAFKDAQAEVEGRRGGGHVGR